MTRLRSSSAALLLVVLLALSFSLHGEKPGEKKNSRPAKININTATVEELVVLPGIGEVTAASILQHRKISGPFRKIEELLVIQRISRRKFEKLRDRITVEGAPPRKKKP